MTFLANLMLSCLDLYRHLFSPYLGQSCRFEPTCSRYAEQAIEYHGPLKGLLWIFYRIIRCHPGCHGGHDPVHTEKKGFSP